MSCCCIVSIAPSQKQRRRAVGSFHFLRHNCNKQLWGVCVGGKQASNSNMEKLEIARLEPGIMELGIELRENCQRVNVTRGQQGRDETRGKNIQHD